MERIAIAQAQGAQGEAGVETSGELAAALVRGEKAVRAGAVYIIEARIDNSCYVKQFDIIREL